MSKYIKQDDVFELVRKGVLISNGNFESVCKHIGSLPTIEVMEYPQVEGITPTLVTTEVSEDCISREQVRAKLDYISYAEKDPISIAKRIVENAPSVVPTADNLTAVEDCISRAKALEIYSDLYWIDERLLNFKDELDKVYDDLRNAPSVVPKPKEGEWVRNFDGNEWYWYCTNCKTQWYEDDLWMGGNEFPKYCPNCGAKMKGADDDI